MFKIVSMAEKFGSSGLSGFGENVYSTDQDNSDDVSGKKKSKFRTTAENLVI